MLFRILLLLLLAAPVAPAAAYSVLTHQAIIDTTWDRYLAPQLQHHYPGGTADEMNQAKSYAYGGAILQDMGYYPLGSTLFTNLTHYVRAGDFVRNLLRQARNRNEYAFALGALAHYAADNTGHPMGTNRIIPTVYPDLQASSGRWSRTSSRGCATPSWSFLLMWCRWPPAAIARRTTTRPLGFG